MPRLGMNLDWYFGEFLCGAAVEDRALGCHRTLKFRAAPTDEEGLEWMAESVIRGGALVTTVRHAVVALGIAPGAVIFPVRGLHQLGET